MSSHTSNKAKVDTISYCGPMEYRGAVLSRVNFPGGYISGDSAYHYISDYQGNVRQVVKGLHANSAQKCYVSSAGKGFWL